MSNAYSYYLWPLAIATFFVVGGIATLRKVARGERDDRGNKYGSNAGGGGILALLIGGVLGGALLLTSPTPRQRQALFDHIFHTPAEQIIKVTLRQNGERPYKPLVVTPVTITDRAMLVQIASVLDRAVEWDPSHPSSTWTTRMDLVTTRGNFTFEVSATPPEANGTLVYVMSGETRGWNLGSFRVDGLEKVLESAARQPSTTQPAATPP